MTNNVYVKRSFEYTKLVRSLLKHTGNRKAFPSKPKSAGTTVCFVRGLEDQTGPCSDTIRSIRFAREKGGWSTVVLRRTSTDPFGRRRFLFTWSTTILLSRRVWARQIARCSPLFIFVPSAVVLNANFGPGERPIRKTPSVELRSLLPRLARKFPS